MVGSETILYSVLNHARCFVLLAGSSQPTLRNAISPSTVVLHFDPSSAFRLLASRIYQKLTYFFVSISQKLRTGTRLDVPVSFQPYIVIDLAPKLIYQKPQSDSVNCWRFEDTETRAGSIAFLSSVYGMVIYGNITSTGCNNASFKPHKVL